MRLPIFTFVLVGDEKFIDERFGHRIGGYWIGYTESSPVGTAHNGAGHKDAIIKAQAKKAQGHKGAGQNGTNRTYKTTHTSKIYNF